MSVSVRNRLGSAARGLSPYLSEGLSRAEREQGWFICSCFSGTVAWGCPHELVGGTGCVPVIFVPPHETFLACGYGLNDGSRLKWPCRSPLIVFPAQLRFPSTRRGASFVSVYTYSLLCPTSLSPSTSGGNQWEGSASIRLTKIFVRFRRIARF